MSNTNWNGPDAMSRLLYEIYFINERIMTGDIYSNAFALPKCVKICAQIKKEFLAEGCVSIDLEPYCAAGGWIGLRYCYCYEDGVIIEGSQVPRRIDA